MTKQHKGGNLPSNSDGSKKWKDMGGQQAWLSTEEEVLALANKLPQYYLKGESDSEVCAAMGISKQTFANYRRMYPVLQEAYELAKTNAEAFWSRKGKEGTFGEAEVNANMYKFQMTNRFQWGDKVQTEVTGKDGGAINVNLTEQDVAAFDKKFDNDY